VAATTLTSQYKPDQVGLQLFPDIVKLHVRRVELLGLDDLEEGIQGNSTPMDVHIRVRPRRRQAII
jgi:hypothetical protein